MARYAFPIHQKDEVKRPGWSYYPVVLNGDELPHGSHERPPHVSWVLIRNPSQGWLDRFLTPRYDETRTHKFEWRLKLAELKGFLGPGEIRDRFIDGTGRLIVGGGANGRDMAWLVFRQFLINTYTGLTEEEAGTPK